MALINCPDCGREVSNRAPACIHCGCPLESQSAVDSSPQPPSTAAVAQPTSGSRRTGRASTLLGVGFVVAGVIVGLALYFVVPVLAQPWKLGPDSPYTGTSRLDVANQASCTLSPHAELSDGPSRLDGIPEAVDACYASADVQRNAAIGIALAAILAGLGVLVFWHPSADGTGPTAEATPSTQRAMRRWDWGRIGNFTGRTRRSEFWAALGIAVSLSFLGGFLDAVMGPDTYVLTLVSAVFWIWLFLGSTVNRLHDLGYSGWLVLLYLVPLVNLGLLLVVASEAGKAGQNRWGPPVA